MFCEQICPTGAIEVDWEPYTKHHNVRVRDVYDKLLDVEEAKGRIRRLVPLKDIGWDDPWHKVTGHPRLKVVD